MHLFDQEIACIASGNTQETVTITDNWSINTVPNGGYILGLMANAMLQHSDRQATPIFTINYMARCLPGKADIVLEQMPRSRQFNRLEARLLQNGEEKARAMGTLALEQDECFVDHREASIPEIAPLDACIPLPELPTYTLYDQMDLRLDPACTGWMTGGQLAEQSIQKGWIKFREDRPFDIPAIALIADSFPPAVLASQGIIAWVPTLELSLNIRSLPKTRWLKCMFRTRFITCGLVEEDGEVWDEQGGLVAISRQIAQFRTAAPQ